MSALPAATGELFREAMRLLPAAVTILATARGDEVAAMTATAVTSYSANPPSMLCSVDHQARSHEALEACRAFSISVLCAEQSETALLFARSDDDKFGCPDLTVDAGHGVPYVEGAVITLLCERVATYAHFDHSMLVGRVLAGRVDPGRTALVYAGRRFWSLAGLPTPA